MEISKYLADRAKARIIWVGRRHMDDAILKKIKEIKDRGGEAFYIEADITELNQAVKAIKTAKKRFGPINGVVHSAIVLRDKTIQQMDEDIFRRVMAPKVSGTYALWKAVKDESLDFFALFSSLNSLTGSAGQGNYSAGCSFKDAFGHYLKNKYNLPVKIINWGYWGETGIVATKPYKRRLERQGILSLSNEDGIKAFDNILSSPHTQAIAAELSDDGRRFLGIDPRKIIFDQKNILPDIVSDITPAVIRQTEDYAEKNRRQKINASEMFSKINEFGYIYLLRTIQKMGAMNRANERYSWEELKSKLGIIKEHDRLFDALLDIMFRTGYIIINDKQIIVTDKIMGPEIKNAPNLMYAEKELIKNMPDSAAYIKLLSAFLDNYPAIVTGRKSGIETIFPAGSDKLTKNVYGNNILADYYNGLFDIVLAEYVQERLRGDKKARINILEIGAGTGGSSDTILKSISRFSLNVSYCYSDISLAFLGQGEKRYGSKYPFAEFKVLDISKDPEPQGFKPGEYDIILAANVLHATKNIKNTLFRVKQLLKTNGLFLLNETTKKVDFSTMIFGLTDGWWLYEDEYSRIKHSPLLTSDQWRVQLDNAGFRNILRLDNSIVVASSDGSYQKEIDVIPKNHPMQTKQEKIGGFNLKGRREEGDYTDAEWRIANVWREVLGYNDIDINDNFFEIGGDSLLIIQVHKRLEDLYPGRINIADLFSYSTVTKLARYLEQRVSGEREREIFIRPASDKDNDVAIVGIALKASLICDITDFWRNLKNGKDCVREIPLKRKKDLDDYWNFKYKQKRGLPVYQKSGYLEEVDKFDYNYFKLSPRGASLIDPSQRLFLETVYDVIDDAGQGGGVGSTKTGLYIGFSSDYFYRAISIESNSAATAEILSGNAAGLTSGRISYPLDLKGPSLVTDTTCSSALVSLHLACKAIQRGECDQAIAGGIKLNILPFKGVSSIGIESKDGYTRSFDDSSDGTNWSEAVAAVFLKPLSKAIADKDNIYAVIKGSAVNQDGTGVGLTAPNAVAQAEVIESAWQDAGIDPKTISYIEAHGTGTKLGDPIEIEGITKAFKKYTPEKTFCRIGSVKPNLGHTAEASGLVGLIKTALALKHKQIPPSIHFKEPNHKIDWNNSPVYVNTKLTKWERQDEATPLRAGVSSFGLSGTNCHVVLEEAPPQPRFGGVNPASGTASPHLLLLSAKTETALRELVSNYWKFLTDPENKDISLADISYTAACGREHHACRLAIVAPNKKDLREKLSALKKINPDNWNKAGDKGIYYGFYRALSPAGEKQGKGDLCSKDRKNIYSAAERFMAEAAKPGTGNKTARALFSLARLYAQGASPDWNILYRNEDVCKTSLPTYPFAKTRCWIEMPEVSMRRTLSAAKQEKYIHPLLERCLSKSMDQDVYETEFSAAKHFVLSDHRIGNKCVLPGTAYIEMAVQIGKIYYHNEFIEISNVSFFAPAFFKKGETRTIQVVVKKGDNILKFAVIAQNGSGITDDWVKYAEGEIRAVADQKKAGRRDISDLKSECQERTIDIASQNKNEHRFISFGPRWQNLYKLAAGNDSALAEISLPSEFRKDLDDYYIHTALLDIALAAGYLSLEGKKIDVLPLSYGSFLVYGPTPAKFFSYFRKKKIDIEG